jgi:hypothetical protein
MRKGNPRAIEVGMRVAERAAKLAGLDMPTKWRSEIRMATAYR